MIPADTGTAEDRVRAKVEARRGQTARQYLYELLCATHPHTDATAILDRLERETLAAERIRAVPDLYGHVEPARITPRAKSSVCRAALDTPA